jgi:hypothetical protein
MKRRIERCLDIRSIPMGSGITAAAEQAEHSVMRIGKIFYTQILVDLTGLDSGGTADDIIGDADAANCHLGKICAGTHGTIIAGRLSCLETPATGDDDLNLYSADEAVGVQDAAISGLTETQLINGGDHTNATSQGLTALPADEEYLYLTGGAGDCDATYTAGKVLIELWGV